MLWQVPRMWEGGSCIIIGGGPSMLEQFDVPAEVKQGVYSGHLSPAAYSPYLKAIHKQHIIAVNVAYRIGPWIDMMFFGDDSTWKEEKKDLLQFKGLRITCAPSLNNDSRLKWLKRDSRKRHGISKDPSMLAWNSNSGSASINLAVHLGVKRIILLGFDMSLDDQNNQHWHKFYKTADKQIPSTFRRHLEGFQTMKKDLDELGVEVINCSTNSKIQEFKKMNFKDIKL